jgi:CHAP domain/Putative peptidoglycan binding domain
MRTAGDFLNSMRGKLGIREVPPHSNRTPIGEAFGMNGVAWCAETVSVAATEAGFPFLHTPSVAQIIGWARSGFNGLSWHPSGPMPGDIACYGNGEHTGVVESVSGTMIHTIEGNWGDQCLRLTRNANDKWITGYARLPFAAPAPVPSPTPPAATGAWPPAHNKVGGIYQSGDTGPWVAVVQMRLNAITGVNRLAKTPGVPDALEVDGKFQTESDKVARWFQGVSGLGVDGQVGGDTLDKMAAVEQFLHITY